MLVGERVSERLGDSNGSGKSKYIKREIDTKQYILTHYSPKYGTVKT